MELVDIILELLGLYLLYKLVFDFIIPIAESTKQVRKQFSDIQNKMREQSKQFNQPQATTNSSAYKQSQQKPPNDDYIDFEEIK